MTTPQTVRVIHTGRPKPDRWGAGWRKKCGCIWKELAGGTHHGRGIWTLPYDVTLCDKHSEKPE